MYGSKSVGPSLRMISKRHSHNKYKYVCGLPAVKTCHIFAIINAIVTGLSLLALLGCFGTLMYLAIRFGAGLTADSDEFFSLIGVTLVTAAGYIVSSIAVVFAVLLLIGIRKKNPKLVKAYLCYGIVVEILLVGATLVFTFINLHEVFRGYFCTVYVTIALGVCVLYAFVLRVVMNTYIVLKNYSLRANRTEIQALYMLGNDGEMQVFPLIR